MFYLCSVTAEIRQLEAMREAAFGLGMGFARAAEGEDDLDRKLRLFDAFNRSCASVRLSIALALRLQREARLALRGDREPDERDDAREPPDWIEPADGAESYDERDRERETASLPRLLNTLRSVADDAEALMPQAAELPSLRDLLDRVGARPAPKPATPAPPPGPPPGPNALRARLSGGTAALTLAPRPRPALPGLPGLPPRRSTGPPRR